MLTLGMGFKAAGFAVWYFSDGFFLFAVGFLLWSFQETFTTGTLESLTFDTLREHGREDEYERVTGKAKFYATISIGVSMVAGSLLASYDFGATILLSSLFMLSAGIPAWFLGETRTKMRRESERDYASLLKNAIREAAGNPTLVRLMLYGIFAVGVAGDLDEYEQLYFDWTGLPLALFGTASLAIKLLQALGARIAYRVKGRGGGWGIYLLSLFASLALGISVIHRTVLSIPFFAAVFFFVSIGDVLVEARLQREIAGEGRATVTSINSLVTNLSGIVFLVVFGSLSIVGGLEWVLCGFALMMGLFSCVSLLAYVRRPS
jgi:hypothetical protein